MPIPLEEAKRVHAKALEQIAKIEENHKKPTTYAGHKNWSRIKNEIEDMYPELAGKPAKKNTTVSKTTTKKGKK